MKKYSIVDVTNMKELAPLCRVHNIEKIEEGQCFLFYPHQRKMSTCVDEYKWFINTLKF